jgi:transposase-like protein
MPKRTDQVLKVRAVRLVLEHASEYQSRAAVARQACVGRESLRRWVVQAEIDAGTREGATSDEAAEVKALKAENWRLREDVAILKAATSLVVGELDPGNR